MTIIMTIQNWGKSGVLAGNFLILDLTFLEA